MQTIHTSSILPAERREEMILPGGRRIGWAEWGAPEGRPVLFCTGAGTSGSLGFGTDVLGTMGLRLVAIDRPGLGRSDHDPARTLESWADDVRRLGEARRWERPLAVGFSQGAVFALALAGLGIVEGIAIVSGQDQFDHSTVRPRLIPEVSGMLEAARANPGQFEQRIASDATDEWLWNLILDTSAPGDRAIYGTDPFADRFRDALREGLGGSPAGYARDLVLSLGPWPVLPERITVPVDLWYGAADLSPVHSPDHGRSLAMRFPDATYELVPGHGSAILWTHAREILDRLTRRSSRRLSDRAAERGGS